MSIEIDNSEIDSSDTESNLNECETCHSLISYECDLVECSKCDKKVCFEKPCAVCCVHCNIVSCHYKKR